MKKGIYIVDEDIEKNVSGVNKKILAQIEAFEKSGITMKTHLMAPHYIKGYKLLYRLPFANLAPRWRQDARLLECDFIYLRKPFLSWPFIRFLDWVKKNSNVKIIMEIPTYPYDRELTEHIKDYPSYLKDCIGRRRLRGRVDRIATLTKDKEIFGVKTLFIKNGFDFEKIRLRKLKNNDNSIHLCFVAAFNFWHGYERLIKGLRNYYDEGGKRIIKFHFAGDGPECRSYRKLVSKLNLEKYVKFYGMKSREEIERIYDVCDIGVASFGLYKIGLDYSCVLKSKEYLAAGLPIATGARMDVMECKELLPYILEFPNDESIVGMDRIIHFYDGIYGGEKEKAQKMAEMIRDVGVEKWNMQMAMEEAIRYVKEKI